MTCDLCLYACMTCTCTSQAAPTFPSLAAVLLVSTVAYYTHPYRPRASIVSCRRCDGAVSSRPSVVREAGCLNRAGGLTGFPCSSVGSRVPSLLSRSGRAVNGVFGGELKKQECARSLDEADSAAHGTGSILWRLAAWNTSRGGRRVGSPQVRLHKNGKCNYPPWPWGHSAPGHRRARGHQHHLRAIRH